MRAVKLAIVGELSSVGVQEVPIPELMIGEVLVKIESSPILPIDVTFLSGVLGHEGSGTVVESGGGQLATSLVGKRVYVFHLGGVWAEYLVCPATECVPLLDEITFDQGASLINPLMILEFREIISNGGHHACVQTAANSALGKMFIRFCHNEGLPLVNIVRSEKSAESLRNRRVENVLNSSDPGFEAECADLCTRLNVTVGFDAVAGETTEKLRNLLAPGGIVYVIGSLSLKKHPSTLPNREGLLVLWWIAEKSAEERETLFKSIQRELTTTFQTEIAGHYRMDQVQDAVRSYLSDMSVGKRLIHPNRK